MLSSWVCGGGAFLEDCVPQTQNLRTPGLALLGPGGSAGSRRRGTRPSPGGWRAFAVGLAAHRRCRWVFAPLVQSSQTVALQPGVGLGELCPSVTIHTHRLQNPNAGSCCETNCAFRPVNCVCEGVVIGQLVCDKLHEGYSDPTQKCLPQGS